MLNTFEESENYEICTVTEWRNIVFNKNNTLNHNLSKPTGHVMHNQFNIQQLYTPPTLY